jgi:hypothetical protein
MKIPVGFGTKFFFRVFMPGSILALALYPLFLCVVSFSSVNVEFVVYFSATTLVCGTIVFMLDSLIYIGFEGRRFWPNWMFSYFVKLQRRTLYKLHTSMRSNNAKRNSLKESKLSKANAFRAALESATEIAKFPLDEVSLRPTAAWPTRVGNLIASYEQYPSLKYGLDAVFFWPRLWVSLNKELREEIDEQQAQSDGLLYSSFSFLIAALLFALYGLLSALDLAVTSLSTKSVCVVAVIFCLVMSRCAYLVALSNLERFGDIFRATFDQHKGLLKYEEISQLLTNSFPSMESHKGSFVKKNRAIWRYLKWHRIRLKGSTKNRRIGRL